MEKRELATNASFTRPGIMHFIKQLKGAEIIVNKYTPRDNYDPYGNGAERGTTDETQVPVFQAPTGATEGNGRNRLLTTPELTTILAVAMFATACASNTGAPKPAEVIMAAEQAGQGAGEQAPAITQEHLESLSNQIQQTFESRGISDEDVAFATSAYDGPDSTGPQLVKNTELFYAFSQEPPQNWQALWISQLSSGNPDVVQAVVEEFSITPTALEDYIRQGTNALNGITQRNGGSLPDYKHLSTEHSIAGNVDSATTLHFVALLEGLKRVLSLAQNGDVTLPTKSTLEDKSGEFEYTTVTINGKIQDKPINIQVTPEGKLRVGEDITTELSYFNWQTGENLAGLYSLTAVNAPNENGALILTGNIQSADK